MNFSGSNIGFIILGPLSTFFLFVCFFFFIYISCFHFQMSVRRVGDGVVYVLVCYKPTQG